MTSEEDSTACFSALQLIALVHFSCLRQTCFTNAADSCFWIKKIQLPFTKWQRGKVIYLLLNIKQSAAQGQVEIKTRVERRANIYLPRLFK